MAVISTAVFAEDLTAVSDKARAVLTHEEAGLTKHRASKITSHSFHSHYRKEFSEYINRYPRRSIKVSK